MPRIRSIKPEFFMSETVCSLSMLTRLTFIGLWTYSDDEGRSRNVPALVKAAVWPLDEGVTVGSVIESLEELCEAGLIERYEVAGKGYIQVVNWLEHQKINKPTPSKFPAQDGTLSDEYGSTTGVLPGGKEQGTGKGTGKPSTGNEVQDRFFDEFWKVYPRRVEKKRAKTKFLAALGAKVPPHVIIEGARKYAAQCEALKTEKNFIAHPATWLHNERWDDEYIEPKPPEDDGIRPFDPKDL